MKAVLHDWDAEDIKGAIRKKRTTLRALSGMVSTRNGMGSRISTVSPFCQVRVMEAYPPCRAATGCC